MQELLEDYDMFVEKDILSVLCDNGGMSWRRSFGFL